MTKAGKRAAPLSDDDLAIRDVPIAYVDDRFIRAADKPKVLGLKLEHNTDAQQILEWQDLALAGRGERSLSDLVDPGYRALTLHIPPELMSIELIRPGDYVDLLGVLDERKGTTESIVLLQKVMVLAVGVETTRAHEAKTGGQREDQLLTIAVSLQDSQQMALAVQKGPVMAVLRSPGDPSVSSKVAAVTRVTPTPPVTAQAPIAIKDPKPAKLTPQNPNN
jgi:pilus assembly protein CpaB